MQERVVPGPASSRLWEALALATSPFSSPTLSPGAGVSVPSSASRRPVSRPQGSCLPELNFKCNSKFPAKSFGWGSERQPLPDPNPHHVGWVGHRKALGLGFLPLSHKVHTPTASHGKPPKYAGFIGPQTLKVTCSFFTST